METSDQPEIVPEMLSENGKHQALTDSIEQSQLKDENSFNSGGMWPEYCNPSYRMPPVIEVKVSVNGQGDYYFPVSVTKVSTIKSYLGGYRHKYNGLLYHHASSQTPPDTRRTIKDTSNLRSRDTQTCEYVTRSIQSQRESGTQMERVDLAMDVRRDKVLVARTYFTSQQLLLLQKKKTVVMQRVWRGYIARCVAERIRRDNAAIEKQQSDARSVSEKRLQSNNEKVKEDSEVYSIVHWHSCFSLWNNIYSVVGFCELFADEKPRN